MAQIVIGIGTSHTPQVSMGASMWSVHSAAVDHTLVDMEASKAAAPQWMSDEVAADRIEEKYEICQGEIEHLSKLLASANPDVVVVFGDDHREVFDDECNPGIAVYCGDQAWDFGADPNFPLESLRASDWAYHGTDATAYEMAGELGQHIVRVMCERGIDPSAVNGLSEGHSIGHAFTFIERRFVGDRGWSMVPIWLNAFYPPNQPNARRCYEVGQAVRAAIESWPGDERVAIIASGGLSHYLVDQDFDERVLKAISDKDEATLTSVTNDELESGTGETRMWIAAAGALENLTLTHQTYVPGFRSVAGTGVGLGFVAWT